MPRNKSEKIEPRVRQMIEFALLVERSMEEDGPYSVRQRAWGQLTHNIRTELRRVPLQTFSGIAAYIFEKYGRG